MIFLYERNYYYLGRRFGLIERFRMERVRFRSF